MKIIIPDDYQNIISRLKCFSTLKDHEVVIYNDTVSENDLLFERFKEADCIVLTRERTKLNKELLDKLPKLKLISQTGKVSSHIDVKACTKNKIAVAEGIGSPIAPAELTWTLIMASLRGLIPAVNDFKIGKWQTNIGNSLNGKTLGIWGYGKIGKLVASYGKVFGMKVLIWGSEASREKAIKDGYNNAVSKKHFFTESDVLSLHLRLTDSTKGIVELEDLLNMKKESLFANISRAELVEPEALHKALLKGTPGFAALDVYESEPIYDKNYWSLKMDNVLCTPHLGYVEKNGYELYFGKAFENINNFFKGNPQNILNPEVLRKSNK